MQRACPDALTDQLLKRCIALSLVIHAVCFGAMIPLARARQNASHPLTVTFIDVATPITKALTKLEDEKTAPPKPAPEMRVARAPRQLRTQQARPATPSKPVTARPTAKPSPETAIAKAPNTPEAPKPTRPEQNMVQPQAAPREIAKMDTPRERSLPPGPLPFSRWAKLPTDPSSSPRITQEAPGEGAKGASLKGKVLPTAPGPLPFDPNDAGGAKTTPGGRGPADQTPLPRGVPIGKKEANLPYNPNLLAMGGGRSGLGDATAPRGGPVDPLHRRPETVFLGGGGGGEHLPKALPRIGGGGGAPMLLASNARSASDPVRTGRSGQGPGEGGGIGYGIGRGIGFSRGDGIGLTDGKVPVGVLHPGIGRGIGQGRGDGIGIGTASRAGQGESGPGTGEGSGYGYGRGNGIGMGNGQGGSKFRPRFLGLPFGEPGGMVGGKGRGGGGAGSGPGGPGNGVRAVGRGRGSGGGGEGGTGFGFGGGVGRGIGGGGNGSIGSGLGGGPSGTGAGSGGGRPGGFGENPGGGGGGRGVGLNKARPGFGGSGGGGGGGLVLTRGFIGDGLNAEYYDDPKKDPGDYIVLDKRPAPGQRITWPTFTHLKVKRVDKQINFHWNSREPEPELDPTTPEAAEFIKNKMHKPAPGVGPTYFSVRWTGKFYVPEEDTYTFYLDDLDDGGRLWIDGKLVVESWLIQKIEARSHPIHLEKGIHDLKVEYCQGPEWLNSVVLCWKARDFHKEVITMAEKVRRD